MKHLSLLLLVGVAACKPDIPQDKPQNFVQAVFDPTTGSIPLPNDLVFLTDLNGTCPTPSAGSSPPACAQAELLAAFQGAFPTDQEVSISIPFQQVTFDDHGQATYSAPDLDLSTFTESTFYMVGTANGQTAEIALDPLTAADYAKGADRGTLTVHAKNHQPWAPGAQYSVVVRGGDEGVKTTDGQPIYASQTFALIEQGKDMALPENIGLLKAQTGSTAAAITLGIQLNAVIALYKQTAFPAADLKFPHEQLAIALTFKTQVAVTNVTINAAAGEVPLPIDLLRDLSTGKLSKLAACTLAGSSLDANGNCPSASAAGFEALDGFSTTGAILAPTSELVAANTVTSDTVKLYDLSDPANPQLVPAASLIVEPCELTSGCGDPFPLSPVIAIQPAGATAGDPTSVFRTKPLKDATDYAVVITTGVKDKAGNPLGSGTVANVLKFTNPVAINGKSQLQGIDDATASGVEAMRLQLAPVLDNLTAAGTDRKHVAIAYTFHTQTILKQGAQLGALPYTLPAATAFPGAITKLTPAAAFARYGVDPAIVPSSNIQEILETDIQTLNALDPATGAFLADPTHGTLETIHVLIAVPKPGAVPACTNAQLAGAGLHCAPMMIFRHGLGAGRASMLTVADTYAAAGMVTVAIDAAKHGDRSFCTPGGPAAQCAITANGAPVNSVCVSPLPPGAQGDASPPGTCVLESDHAQPGFFQYAPVSPSCAAPGSCGGYAYAEGIPVVSANYLISANFFRSRDTFRQDFIDESQLVRAIQYIPTGTAADANHTVFAHLTSTLGFTIDPAVTYFSGQSLGAIQGVGDVATNPRISKAAFNVGGGTVVDVFTNSPAFASTTNALLAGLGIQPGTSKYLQFLVVAKTILDPADPVNFAGHLTEHTLPNLLVDQTGATAQAPKKVMAQAAFCDQTVPNPFDYILGENFNTVGPMPIDPTFGAGTGTFTLFFNATTGGVPNAQKLAACTTGSTPGAVPHGFITNWSVGAATAAAQSDIAAFVTADTAPPSLRVVP